MSQRVFQCEETFECAICSTSVESQYAIAILACQHKFHLGCFITFVTSKDDSYCPTCHHSVELNPFKESNSRLVSKHVAKDKHPEQSNPVVSQETRRPKSHKRKNARKQRGLDAFLQMMFDGDSSVNQGNETQNDSTIAGQHNSNHIQQPQTTQVVPAFNQLYNKICQAEARAQRENQETVLSYYRFGEALSKRIAELTSDGTPLQMARSKLNKEVRKQLPIDVSDFTLRKKIEKSRKIYDIFGTLGVDKIHRIGYFTADAISRLTRSEIQYIINVASVEYRIKIEQEEVN